MMNKPEHTESPIKLLRTAKGKRPQFFSDPDVDRLLAIIVPLIGEVAVLRDRLDAVERVAEKHDLFAQEEIEKFDPSADEQQARDSWREQYLDRIFRIAQSELEETTAGRGVDLDKVIEDFTAGRI
ncbi:MAG: hypothetical protein OER85_12380 [Gammaproteobacteria bacterium]|jgi:hypothetical protein|nr:hypothetical protein [Gammaproteobacteria bacterium]